MKNLKIAIITFLVLIIPCFGKEAYVVHGMMGMERAYRPIMQQLERQGFKVQYFSYSSAADILNVAKRLNQRISASRSDYILVVAHSMGGAIARKALTWPVGKEADLITIATPFAGAKEATYAPFPYWGGRMDPDGEFVQNPGALVTHARHYKVETDETGATQSFYGISITDDAVSLENQRFDKVDHDAQLMHSILFVKGHVGVLSSEDLKAYLTQFLPRA